MSRIEDTVGDVTYTIPNCDCGLTGGCEKCQPLILTTRQNEAHFMDDNLREYYREKGLLYQSEEVQP